jgi:hypothetical protein
VIAYQSCGAQKRFGGFSERLLVCKATPHVVVLQQSCLDVLDCIQQVGDSGLDSLHAGNLFVVLALIPRGFSGLDKLDGLAFLGYRGTRNLFRRLCLQPVSLF